MVEEPHERPFRPGWPFVTRELIKQRARQREELRLVGDDILRGAAKDMGSPVEVDTDRALIETELRRRADALRRIGDVDGYLEQVADLTRAKVLGRWGGETYGARGGDAEQLGRQFQNHWLTLTQQSKPPPPKDDRDAATVFEYVMTLVIADELAGDGYRDPRLP
jgi:hypothetical protein